MFDSLLHHCVTVVNLSLLVYGSLFIHSDSESDHPRQNGHSLSNPMHLKPAMCILYISSKTPGGFEHASSALYAVTPFLVFASCVDQNF